MRDLLIAEGRTDGDSSVNGGKMDVYTDEYGRVQLVGIKNVLLADENHAMRMITLGAANRSVAATMMNVESSRSHMLAILGIRTVSANGRETVSKLCLIDL